ncbi:hypothetical protein TWF281_003210 [Arthrobotrys megalospora]
MTNSPPKTSRWDTDMQGIKSHPPAQPESEASSNGLFTKRITGPTRLCDMNWPSIDLNPRMLNWSDGSRDREILDRRANETTSRCDTQGVQSYPLTESKSQAFAGGSLTKQNTTEPQRLSDMDHWPSREYELGLLNDDLPKTVPPNIPSYGASAFSGLCPSKEGGWSPCYLVSSLGAVGISSENPAAKVFQAKSIPPALRAVGRLFDPTTGCSGSGFWLEGGLFVTGLHFAPWNVPNKPTSDELRSFRDKGRVLYVSCETIVPCSKVEPSSVKVYFLDFTIDSDLAVFRPHDASYQPDSCIAYKQIIESTMLETLESLQLDLSNCLVFAAGYNSRDYSELGHYIEAYKNNFPERFQDAGGSLPSEPDYDFLFRPDRKTVTCGNIIKKDSTSRILIDCSCWKGYSGGPIMVYNGGDPCVIGMIVGGFRDAVFLNEGIKFPDGFIAQLRRIYKC